MVDSNLMIDVCHSRVDVQTALIDDMEYRVIPPDLIAFRARGALTNSGAWSKRLKNGHQMYRCPPAGHCTPWIAGCNPRHIDQATAAWKTEFGYQGSTVPMPLAEAYDDFLVSLRGIQREGCYNLLPIVICKQFVTNSDNSIMLLFLVPLAL